MQVVKYRGKMKFGPIQVEMSWAIQVQHLNQSLCYALCRILPHVQENKRNFTSVELNAQVSQSVWRVVVPDVVHVAATTGFSHSSQSKRHIARKTVLSLTSYRSTQDGHEYCRSTHIYSNTKSILITDSSEEWDGVKGLKYSVTLLRSHCVVIYGG